MKISPVNQLQSNFEYKTNFRANGRRVLAKGPFEAFYKTYTKFFRNDLDWTGFAKLIEQKYKDVSKINIISHACSNGSESYSLLLKLLSRNKLKPEQYSPIMAYDYDLENIILAQKNYLEANFLEVSEIEKQTGKNISTFFDTVTPMKKNCLIDEKFSDFPLFEATLGRSTCLKQIDFLRAKPEIKDKIIFRQGDIFNDIDNIPDKNVILMCRNFWPYLTIEKNKQLADKIAQKLDDSSLVVIGVFDKEAGIDRMLEERGFIETEVKNVFVKASPAEKFFNNVKKFLSGVSPF